MADVFSASYDAPPVASTSRLSLESESGRGELPTLAQLLHETLSQSPSSSSGPSLASLPSLSSPSARSYLGSLLAKDLPSLLREPAELAQQSDALDADLANLCYRSTGDLLGVGDCVDGVEDGFGQVSMASQGYISQQADAILVLQKHANYPRLATGVYRAGGYHLKGPTYKAQFPLIALALGCSCPAHARHSLNQ